MNMIMKANESTGRYIQTEGTALLGIHEQDQTANKYTEDLNTHTNKANEIHTPELNEN